MPALPYCRCRHRVVCSAYLWLFAARHHPYTPPRDARIIYQIADVDAALMIIAAFAGDAAPTP